MSVNRCQMFNSNIPYIIA